MDAAPSSSWSDCTRSFTLGEGASANASLDRATVVLSYIDTCCFACELQNQLKSTYSYVCT